MKNTAQLTLFEHQIEKQIWNVRDIWTPQWKLSINLAIVMACTETWTSLKELSSIASIFSLEINHAPFSYQVRYLAKIGKLKERTNPQTNFLEWIAA